MKLNGWNGFQHLPFYGFSPTGASLYRTSLLHYINECKMSNHQPNTKTNSQLGSTSTQTRSCVEVTVCLLPQLLSASPSCVRMKFSIQKGWHTHLRVNESHSPWFEQFSWQTAESARWKERKKERGSRRARRERAPGHIAFLTDM